jgi:helix-turn-helix protein
MSVAASTWAWGQRLRGNRKLVLLALADVADDGGACYPGQGSLAAKCGLSRRRLRDHLAALEAGGYIARQRRHRANGSRTSDLYRLDLADVSSPDAGDRPYRTQASPPEPSVEPSATTTSTWRVDAGRAVDGGGGGGIPISGEGQGRGGSA